MEQQIIAGVLIIVLGAFLVGVGKLTVNFFKGLKDGQTEIMGQCQAMALTLKGFEGKFVQGEQWMALHQEADDRAFMMIQNQHEEIKLAINHCADKHDQ